MHKTVISMILFQGIMCFSTFHDLAFETLRNKATLMSQSLLPNRRQSTNDDGHPPSQLLRDATARPAEGVCASIR